MNVCVAYKSQVTTLPLLVMKGKVLVRSTPCIQATLQKHAAVFQDGLEPNRGLRPRFWWRMGQPLAFAKHGVYHTH